MFKYTIALCDRGTSTFLGSHFDFIIERTNTTFEHKPTNLQLRNSLTNIHVQLKVYKFSVSYAVTHSGGK